MNGMTMAWIQGQIKMINYSVLNPQKRTAKMLLEATQQPKERPEVRAKNWLKTYSNSQEWALQTSQKTTLARRVKEGSWILQKSFIKSSMSKKTIWTFIITWVWLQNRLNSQGASFARSAGTTQSISAQDAVWGIARWNAGTLIKRPDVLSLRNE